MNKLPVLRETPNLNPAQHEGHPLVDPATGVFGSAFEAQAVEMVPPADILAELHPPKGEPGMAIPDTIDGVRALKQSIGAFSNRATPRTQNRLNVYAHAVDRKEDELDPPLSRYLRTFQEEVTGRLDGMEELDGLLDTIFGQGARPAKLSDEIVERWTDLFYTNPRAIAPFYLFVNTAENQGHTRKDWGDKQHTEMVTGLNTRISGRYARMPEDAADWYIGAIPDMEAVFAELEGFSQDGEFDYKLADSKHSSYAILANMAWSQHVRQLPPARYMETYNYKGLQKFLGKMDARFGTSEHKDALAKFTADINRTISSAMIRQKVLTLAGESNSVVYSTVGASETIPIFNAALRSGEGHVTTNEEFDAVIYEYLGGDVKFNKDAPLITLKQFANAAQSSSGILPSLGSRASRAADLSRTDTHSG